MEIRLLAPLSLAIASVGFIATLCLRDSFAIGILRSFFEAAMVGGLADWFAVVALFDHPLKVPIPHTAILRTKRKQLEESVLKMLEKLLPSEDIVAKIRELNLLDRGIEFWTNKEKRNWFLREIRNILIRLIQQLNAAELAKVLTSMIQALAIQKIPALSKRISIYLVANYKETDCIPEKAFVLCVQSLHQFSRNHESSKQIETLLTELLDQKTIFRISKLVGIPASQFAARQLGEWLISWLRTETDLEQQHEANKLREFYKMLYKNLANELNDPSSQVSVGLDQLWDNWLSGSQARNILAGYLEQWQSDLLEDLEEVESKFMTYIVSTVDDFVARLQEDRSFWSQVQTWLNENIPKVIVTVHAAAKEYVKDKLASYGDDELISIIKEHVGGDLQWIRLNGALVGGLVGLFLHLIRVLID
jgi:uncharacterized membrane-anchored protein YjiN (DUF445 family)